MKFHLPVRLFQSLLLCLSVACFTVNSGVVMAEEQASIILGEQDTLTVDYADAETLPDVGGILQLLGGTQLDLSNCGEGDGKTYTLLTGVSGVLDAEGNELILDSTNNAASLYFDTTQPGTGFWADATLQLTTDGTLQLVRHNETVKDAVTITTRQIGGADYQYYEGVSFKDINSTSASGGAIYGGNYRTITLSGNGSVTFSGNKASDVGGAIYGYGSTITLSNNGSVTFSENSASSSGGAIYGGDYSTITLSGNGSVEFSGNKASSSGGAIYGRGDSTIELSGNGSVTFSGNKASSSSGGAIYGYGSTITLSNNGSVTFSGNTASSSSRSNDASGGAIYGGTSSTITLSDNESVTFSGNTASSSYSSATGGAIYGWNSTITLSNNGSVTFSGNTASSSSSLALGGAIYGNSSTITLSGNGSVEFSGNTAGGDDIAYGGAIYGYSGSTITLSGNGSVEFSGNTASASSSGSNSYARGGAIYGESSTITLSDNESVTFSGNTASSSSTAYGGAIYGYYNSTIITLSNNGSVTFSGNTASASSSYARGGAIYGGNSSTITLSGNGSVTFSGNTASSSSSSYGGAIYSNGIVTITGNDEVTFAQNVEKSGSTYRLRSLYMAGDSSTDKLTLSAGEKQSIRFYDSVYMGAKGSVELNADYTDAEGVTRKATGTILFSGATTEDDLKDAKGGVAGTEEEILNSRTSEINSAATLYGGTLQVQDKAVLKLNGGLTVADGSKASVQVQAAELNVGSHALNMVSGSSLELSDGAKLTATELTITTGATLAVRGSVSTAQLTATVAALTLSDETVAGFDAARAVNTGSVSVLEGDLTLESGSLLSLDDAYLELSGNLFFDVAEGEEKIALDIAPGVITDENNQVVLFNVDGVVTFGFDGLTASADNGMVYCVKAEDYFTGSRVQESTKLVYDSKSGVVYLEDVTEGTVPEPTSSMLSLLGLVAFTLRRRRK